MKTEAQRKKITKLFFVFLYFFTLFVASSSIYAQSDPKRGRLPDGRAYRTDRAGNKIVDYVAELELNLEAKERQIQSLKRQLKELNAKVNLLRENSYELNKGVKEVDLLANQDNNQDKGEGESRITAAVKEGGSTREASLKSAEEEIAKLEERIKALEKELNFSRESAKKYQSAYREEKERATRIEARVKTLEGILAKKENEEKLARKSQDSVLRAYKEKVKEAEERLKEANKEIALLREKLLTFAKTAKPVKQRREVALLAPRVFKVVEPKASFKESIKGKNLAKSKEAKARLSFNKGYNAAKERNRARASIKSKISYFERRRLQLYSMLGEINNLLRKRDQEFKEFNKTSKHLKLLTTAPSSKRGNTLANIKRLIAKAKSEKDLSFALSELLDIKRKIKEDLNTVKRLRKRRGI